MLAARDRAAGAASRAAILRSADEAREPGAAPSTGTTPSGRPIASTKPPGAPPVPTARVLPPEAPPEPPPPPGSTDADTLARLREAKRRARGG
jgi:hypothetical protein